MDQPKAHAAMELPQVALLGPNVRHRGKPAGIFGGKESFEKAEALDRVGIERREKARHVAHLVDRHPVHKEKVLVIIPTPDVHPGHAFRPQRDSRQLLDAFHQVRLAHEGRDLLDASAGEDFVPRLVGKRRGMSQAVGIHHKFLQGNEPKRVLPRRKDLAFPLQDKIFFRDNPIDFVSME